MNNAVRCSVASKRMHICTHTCELFHRVTCLMSIGYDFLHGFSTWLIGFLMMFYSWVQFKYFIKWPNLVLYLNFRKIPFGLHI